MMAVGVSRRMESGASIQCDEVWQFCYAKAKNVPAERLGQFGYGDVWTWIALDADTKLVPSWLVSTRDAGAAYTFMMDVASRLKNKVQLTTDGHKPYLSAVEDAFGAAPRESLAARRR